MIISFTQNLLEKPSSHIAENYAAEMIHFKAVPVLNVLVKQTREDIDMQEDITFLHEKLSASLQDLRYKDACSLQGFISRCYVVAKCYILLTTVQYE